MKKTILSVLIILTAFSLAHCAPGKIPEGASVAVMDFGIHEGAATSDVAIINVGKAAGEYVIERLTDSGHFTVMDREYVEDRIREQELNTVGLIDPDTAQRIGRLLAADYLIYGNVNDVTISDTGTGIGVGGVTVGTMKSHVIMRIMNVATGDIIMASKGEGKSKTSYVRAGTKEIGYISIGTKKVTQDSVHNAVQKAAYQAVDILEERLYGAPAKKK